MNQEKKRKIHVRPSNRRFRFGDVTCKSLGRCILPLATPQAYPIIFVSMDIVPPDVPALLGLDVLDAQSLMADTVTNRLWNRVIISDPKEELRYVDNWSMPLTRFDNHVYAAMSFPSNVFYTKAELKKLHTQFLHPPASRLFNLLRRASKEELPTDTLKTLESISEKCKPCQHIQRNPARFRVSLGAEELRFNDRLIIDVMFFGDKPVLHIVDEATHYSAARFLPDNSTETVWNTLLTCWACIFTGLPHRILVDQGSNFGVKFKTACALRNVIVEDTGTEAHSSLGLGERYHEPLRTTYRKLEIEFAKSNVPEEMLLASAVKAMNDTIGPEGLVPTALVFGEFPSLDSQRPPLEERPTLSSRALVATAARKEMAAIMAKLKVQRALKHNIPKAARTELHTGKLVLVCREKIVNNRISQWMGPYTLISVDYEKKIALVDDGQPQHTPFGLAQVKPFVAPAETDADSIEFIDNIKKSIANFISPEEEFVFMTQVLEKGDKRITSPLMMKARAAEIKGLIDRGTFTTELRRDLPRDAVMMPGKLIFALKSTEDGKEKAKVRFVICGNRDNLKQSIVHETTSIQPPTIRLALSVAQLLDFQVWNADVTQAYLQSASPLNRTVCIRNPPEEFKLSHDEVLRLVRPLYGLCESGDLWYETLEKHLRDDLGLLPARSDPGLFTLHKKGRLQGMNCTYVDDLLRMGTPEYRKLCRKTHEKFEVKEEEELPFLYSGFRVSRNSAGDLLIDQSHYLSKLEELQPDATLSAFRSMKQRLGWLNHTRPDLAYAIGQLQQVTQKIFDENKAAVISELNRTVRRAKKDNVSIQIPKMDKETLRVVGFSDAGFATNRDLSSQLGYIILLMDESRNAIPIHFRSYKSRRKARSAMTAEVLAFSDMVDVATTLSLELQQLIARRPPVQLLTDSLCLFDIISKGSRTTEKRTMIDIAVAREMYKAREVSDIGHVKSEDNLADGLTKKMSQAALLRLLSTGTLDIAVTRWIIRA